MSIARDPLLINPEAIPAQTAYDLAVFIYQLPSEQLRGIISAAKEQYNAPMQSWMWGPLYYLFNFRGRSVDFIQAETLVDERIATPDHLTDVKAFAPYLHIVGKEDGTWKEESANTLLIREFLKHLKGYDHSIQMSLKKLQELSNLLNRFIELRIDLRNKLEKVENNLALACVRIADVERAIKYDRDRIETIRKSNFELEKRQEWIKKVNDAISQKQKQLAPIKAEEITLSLERATIIKDLTELNPAFNQARSMVETDDVYTEAAKIGKAAADGAKREYLTRVEEKKARDRDLAVLKMTAPKLAERKATVSIESHAPAAAIDIGASRVQDAKEECLKSSVLNNDGFKTKLTHLMQSISGQRPVPTKQAVVVEQTDLMRKRQSLLEQSGLFGPRKEAAPKAESSCSHQPQN
ncbi:MAG: hypothetical protein ACYC0J_10355 [Gammaproteobacteria bacterium]